MENSGGQKSVAQRRAFTFFKRGNRFFKSAVLTGSIVLFIVGSYVCLTFSKAQIAVLSSLPKQCIPWLFPWITHNSFQANPFSRPNAVTRENTPSETPSSQSLFFTIPLKSTIRYEYLIDLNLRFRCRMAASPIFRQPLIKPLFLPLLPHKKTWSWQSQVTRMVLHEKLRTLPVRNRFLQSVIDKSVLGKYIANCT